MLNLRWFRKRAAFKLPRRKSPLSGCRMRLIEEADYAACEEIFLLNEPVHFPPARYGAFDLFKAWLRKQESLIVVAERGGLVCGLGGIAVDYVPAEDRRIAWLGFGMVHPDHHGHSIGTALLMCRLSLLPAGHLPMTVCMQSAGAPYRFYKRFGFQRFASAKLAEELQASAWGAFSLSSINGRRGLSCRTTRNAVPGAPGPPACRPPAQRPHAHRA